MKNLTGQTLAITDKIRYSEGLSDPSWQAVHVVGHGYINKGSVHNTKWFEFETVESLHTRTKRPALNIIWHNRILKQLEKFTLFHPDLTDTLLRLSRHHRNPHFQNLMQENRHPLPNPIYIYADIL